jgi:hypothetical protein
MRDSWFYLPKATGRLKYGGTDLDLRHPRCACNIKVLCKKSKTQLVVFLTSLHCTFMTEPMFEFQKFCGIIFIVNGKGKGKAHPRTSHEGPEGE